MERVALLNGITKVQDYDLTALGLSLTSGGVYEWLVLSNVSGNDWKVTKGKALVLCQKTAGHKVLAQFELTADKTFSQVGPFKIWIEINQTNIDNPTSNVADGSGAWSIQYGASYPASNFVALGEVDASNNITMEPTTVAENMAQTLLTVIQAGWSNFFATTGWISNAFTLTYQREVPATGTVSGIAQDVTFLWKADRSNTSNVTLSVNTSLGTLTAPLKKMNDQDLGPWDLEAGLVFGFMWDGSNFQLTTPTAQAPVGTATTISTTGIVWETGGSIAGRPAFVGSGIRDTRLLKQSTGGGTYNFGNGTDIRLEQSIISNDHNLVKSVKVNLKKVWSPADNVIVRLLDKNRNVVATSTTTLAGGTVTTSYVSYTFNFSYPAVIANGQFEIDFSRSGWQDAANYYQIEATGNYEYPHGSIKQFNGTGYTFRDGSIFMEVQFARQYESGKRYLSDTGYAQTSVIDGIFEQAKAYNQSCLITLSGTNNNQIWLTPWSNYFLDTLKFDKNLVHNTDTHFWYQNTNQEKIAQQFVLGSWISVDKILLNIRRQGTPIDQCQIRIETDNNNNEPSGTLVHANANILVNPLDLSLSANWVPDIFNFSGSFNLEAGTKYWIVLQRTDALNTTNYYRTRINNATVYTNGLFKLYQNSAWTTQTWSLFFSFLESFNGADVNQYGERSVATPNSDDMYFWYSRTDNIEQAQMMILDQDTTVSELSLHIRKDWAPTDNMEIRIESNVDCPGTTINGEVGSVSRSADVNIGTTTSQKQAGSYDITDKMTFQYLRLYLSLNNNPSDGLLIRIETDNAWAPSGTLINPDATVTINAMNTFVNAGLQLYPVKMPKAITVLPQRIWVVISRTGSLDNTNYVKIAKYNAVQRGGTWREWNGTAWTASTAHTLNVWFGANFFTDIPSGQLIDPNAIITINGTNLTTTYNFNTYAFPWSFVIPKNTKFWVRFCRQDIRNLNASNFFRVRSNNAGTYWYWYSLTVENSPWTDGLYGRNIVMFFNKFMSKFKYLRKEAGALPVGRGIASTQVTLFPVLPPKDVISFTDGQILYSQSGGIFWANATGTWWGWWSWSFWLAIDMSDDWVTRVPIGRYSEWLWYSNNTWYCWAIPKNKFWKVRAWSSAWSVTGFTWSYLEIK